MKAIFWLLVTIIVCNLIGVGFGFYALYTWVGLWFLVGLSAYIIIVAACIILILKFANKVEVELKEFISKVKTFAEDVVARVKKLTLKDVLSIVYKIFKK